MSYHRIYIVIYELQSYIQCDFAMAHASQDVPGMSFSTCSTNDNAFEHVSRRHILCHPDEELHNHKLF